MEGSHSPFSCRGEERRRAPFCFQSGPETKIEQMAYATGTARPFPAFTPLMVFRPTKPRGCCAARGGSYRHVGSRRAGVSGPYSRCSAFATTVVKKRLSVRRAIGHYECEGRIDATWESYLRRCKFWLCLRQQLSHVRQSWASVHLLSNLRTLIGRSSSCRVRQRPWENHLAPGQRLHPPATARTRAAAALLTSSYGATQNLRDGDRVRVEGVLEMVHHQDRSIFYNQVEATKIVPVPKITGQTMRLEYSRVEVPRSSAEEPALRHIHDGLLMGSAAAWCR